MRTAVRWYRVTCFGKPRGPWRDDEEQARQDAIELGLGGYDEWGQYFDTVPGGIQAVFAIEDQEAA
jgi:hypothetical protein